MSAWNDFVKKIYWENKKKNKNFQFKDALKEASRRKGEMGSSASSKSNKSMKMGKMGNMKSKKCCPCPNKRKTRKTRKSGMFF
jgi:hypothetical protein